MIAPTSRTDSSEHQYVLLDGLRGVAALAVVILHMPRVFGGFTVPQAHLAVDFFLQLSGFIVASAYVSKIQAGMSFRGFTWRRISRLYPAYLLGLLLGIAVAVVALLLGGNGLSVDWAPVDLVCSALLNVTMLPQAFCGSQTLLFPLNPPMWSIFYEVVVNCGLFLFVGIAVVWRRAAVAAALLLPLMVWLTYEAQTLDVGFDWQTAIAGIVRAAFSFLVGVAIFALNLRNKSSSNAVTLLVSALLAAALLLQTDSYWYELAMVVLVFPVLVALGAMFNPSNPWLRWTSLQLGAMSYVLYAIHKPLYQLIYGAMVKFIPQVVVNLGVLLGIVMLAVFAAVSWALSRSFEPWARALLTRVGPMRPRVRGGGE